MQNVGNRFFTVSWIGRPLTPLLIQQPLLIQLTFRQRLSRLLAIQILDFIDMSMKYRTMTSQVGKIFSTRGYWSKYLTIFIV
jgi:hypothetical protein